MHRLLQRQLRRYIGSDTDIPEELLRFVKAIDAAYTQADDDRALIERSLELTSHELLERNKQLRLRRIELEQMVSERTAALEKRTSQLQMAAEVARDATTTRNLNELLNRTVNLIHERFGFYHTAIYLIDSSGQIAILMAATGKAGQDMLDQNFTLRIDKNNSVGIAARSDKAHISDNISSTDYVLLPKTRSDLALPLRDVDRIIGAINVHSQKQGVFDEDIVSILQVLADQLAVAISNSQLLQEMGQTLNKLEAATGRYTKDAWDKVSQRSGSPIGYRYRGLGIEPIESDPEKRSAEENVSAPDQSNKKRLSVPIKMRDQVIGTLSLRIEEDETLPETTLLAESVAERMALALENARLLEETQRRAEHEQLVARVSAQMRETLDVDTVLKRAASEMRQALGLQNVLIHLEGAQQSQIDNRSFPSQKEDTTP